MSWSQAADTARNWAKIARITGKDERTAHVLDSLAKVFDIEASGDETDPANFTVCPSCGKAE